MAAVEPGLRNQPPVDEGATGASQSLLDRKEVLGGVIAGGLVGLIFAVCLVAFHAVPDEEEGRRQLLLGGAQTSQWRCLPETHQAGGVLRLMGK